MSEEFGGGYGGSGVEGRGFERELIQRYDGVIPVKSCSERGRCRESRQTGGDVDMEGNQGQRSEEGALARRSSPLRISLEVSELEGLLRRRGEQREGAGELRVERRERGDFEQSARNSLLLLPSNPVSSFSSSSDGTFINLDPGREGYIKTSILSRRMGEETVEVVDEREGQGGVVMGEGLGRGMGSPSEGWGCRGRVPVEDLRPNISHQNPAQSRCEMIRSHVVGKSSRLVIPSLGDEEVKVLEKSSFESSAPRSLGSFGDPSCSSSCKAGFISAGLECQRGEVRDEGHVIMEGTRKITSGGSVSLRDVVHRGIERERKSVPFSSPKSTIVEESLQDLVGKRGRDTISLGRGREKSGISKIPKERGMISDSDDGLEGKEKPCYFVFGGRKVLALPEPPKGEKGEAFISDPDESETSIQKSLKTSRSNLDSSSSQGVSDSKLVSHKVRFFFTDFLLVYFILSLFVFIYFFFIFFFFYFYFFSFLFFFIYISFFRNVNRFLEL